MKVLFVFSGNKRSGISSIVKNQMSQLISSGLEIETFPIVGKGFKGYFRNIFILRKLLKNSRFEIVHAHNALSSFVASLAEAKPLVVSLMGSDVYGSTFIKHLIQLFNFAFRRKKIIVKSEEMMGRLNLKNCEIIPNGVDLNHFKPLDKDFCKERLSLDKSKKYVLFPSNPCRLEKNFNLASEAIRILNDDSISLQALENVPYEDMPFWLNAADVVVLTSLWEGSPNVIKEALASNRPIVSTDVGDVKKNIESLPGCFITKPVPEDVAAKIKMAMCFSSLENGRQRIVDIGLDSQTVAERIIKLYRSILQTQ